MLVEKVFEVIMQIHDSGTTFLLMEQNAHIALSVANRCYVLEVGKISLKGTGKDLLYNDEVQKAYLRGH